MERVAAVFLLRQDGAALMQHRDNKPEIARPGMWVMPGGHCEPDETVEQCAIREFSEETAYQCDHVRLIGCVPDINDLTGEKYELTAFWAVCDGVQNVRCL